MEIEDWFFGTAILVFLSIVGYFLINEISWAKTPSTEKECHLTAQNYTASTLRTNVIPLYTGKGGMGMAVATSGDPETKTTTWDCGDFGRITTDNKDCYRWGKDTSTLLIKIRGKDYRVKGIIH